MSTSETIVKALGDDHLPLIPREAMDLLESMSLDSAFAGSVFVAKTLVPTLFVKLSAKTASLAGLERNSRFELSYKLLTVEAEFGDTVSMVTLQEGQGRVMHALLDPSNRQVKEFIRLAKQGECFIIDVTVADKKEPYGSYDLYDIDGEHLEWVTRNLVRSANVSASSDWSVAAEAYRSHLGLFSRDILLAFSGTDNQLLHAANSTDFISRGDTDYEPDLDLAMRSITAYELDWLKDQHGIALTDAPAMPVSPELSVKLNKFSPGSYSPTQIKALEVLDNQYPGEAVILFPLLMVYSRNGEKRKSEKTLRTLNRLALKRTYVALTLLQMMPDDEFLMTFPKEWPKRELTDHPIRGGVPFTPKDFVLFEELCIRHALLKEQAKTAIDRFVRLTEFGASGQVLEAAANKISKSLLFTLLDRTPVLPGKLPNSLLAVKYQPARKLLTDSFWGHVEVLRTKMDIQMKANKVASTARSGPRIGRNAPCPCGSGKKYKRCCGR